MSFVSFRYFCNNGTLKITLYRSFIYMSKLTKAQLKAALDAKDAEISALKVQVMHARDLTIHHSIRLLCSIIPHDDNCRNTLVTAVDMLHQLEYSPVVLVPTHA